MAALGFPNGPGVGDLEFKNEIYFKSSFPELLGVRYVALPGGPLPSLFKEGARSKMALGQEVLGSEHRNT